MSGALVCSPPLPEESAEPRRKEAEHFEWLCQVLKNHCNSAQQAAAHSSCDQDGSIVICTTPWLRLWCSAKLRVAICRVLHTMSAPALQ